MYFEYHNLNAARQSARQPRNAAARIFQRPAALRFTCVLALGLCSAGIGCRQSANTAAEPTNPSVAGGVNAPLTSFQANITSTTTRLDLHPGQDIKVPIRIGNPGTERWVSTGRFPVTISYKWFRGAELMPIEGERTILPAPAEPNQTVAADARVVAPNDTGEFTLRISLVQEAVAWFMTKSNNSFLQLPVTVR